MMDYDKLIHCLKCCARVDAQNVGCDDCGFEYCGEECQQLCGTAATALSTLQAENEKLRAELENYRKGHCAEGGCAAEKDRDLIIAENDRLRAELEQVKAERDAAVERIREWEKFDTYLFVHNFITPEKWRGPGKENCP